MTAYRMRKFFTNSTSNRGPIFKIYKEKKKVDNSKQNNPIKNVVHIETKNLSIEESQVTEKQNVLNILNQENSNPNYFEFYLKPVRMPKINNTTGSSCS